MPDSTPPGPSQGPSVHRPVLAREVVQLLDLRPRLTVVDGTVGGGGHSRAILDHLDSNSRLIGLDRDPAMLARAAARLSDPRVTLKQSSYADLPQVLDELGIDAADRVLLDLGLSSDQLADPDRGFGFQTLGRLDMRYDPTRGRPAADLLATLDESELADLFFRYGEERFGRAIARTIVSRRNTHPVQTAVDLVDAVSATLPHGAHRRAESHPATRVFQALRIAVNDELGELERFLQIGLPSCLRPGGRVAVISFHSLEDRLVKDSFRDHEIWENLTSKPITARSAERRMNPRSRTAKLRVAMRKVPPT
jgi:16S rRNA (cytosine1402-N4)-methyltransferase